MALLYALHFLRDELSLSLAVAHLDHGIRSDAGEDLALVQRSAEELGLPFTHARVDVPARVAVERGNLEEVARAVRRTFLERVMGGVGATKIALGHTQSDVAETVLLHLLRGAGPRGLRGILPATPPYVRPLILCSRNEVRAFCQGKGIPFRDDPTNEDRRLLRNAIRLEVLPVLARHNPRAEDALARAAGLCADAEEALAWVANLVLGEVSRAEGVDLELFRTLPRVIQALVVWQAAAGTGAIPNQSHVDSVLDAVRGGRGEVHLPGGMSARIGSGVLSFIPTAGLPAVTRTWELPGAGEVVIEELGWAFRVSTVPRRGEFASPDPRIAHFDPRRVVLPLLVRAPRAGDRLRPLGMEGTKRVHDLLMEARIPRWERARWPILVNGRGIVWVVGVRLSDDHRVLEDATEVLTVEARRL